MGPADDRVVGEAGQRAASDASRERDIIDTMTRLADTLVSDFDQFDLLADLSESCVRILDADTAGVSIRAEDGLRFAAATGPEPGPAIPAVASKRLDERRWWPPSPTAHSGSSWSMGPCSEPHMKDLLATRGHAQ